MTVTIGRQKLLAALGGAAVEHVTAIVVLTKQFHQFPSGGWTI
jgi:hypothetical protein